GGDAGPGREGLRTDSMNVATIDLGTGQAALFGLPRNLKLVPLPDRFRKSFVELEERVIERDLTDEDEDGYPDAWIDEDGDGVPDEPEFESCECFPDMLNTVHQTTEDWFSTYPYSPDPGLSALKEVVSYLLDLHIDYFVMVDMAGFVDVIDAIGGVDVLVKEPYHVTVSAPKEGGPKATVSVEPGMNHLDGLEALAFARWRRGSSDYHRMRRQRCLVRAAATQTNTLELIRAFPTLLDVMEERVTTDIPIDFLPDLVWAAGLVDIDDVATVGFVPPRYNNGRTPGGYPIPNVDRIRSTVRNVIENGAVAQSSTGESECS
ncbi:MAG: LCP family protein, partial [Acidimicrobiia bacterium]|nr:LCP family protein [Acidimicrobiia bacterium]